MKYKIHALSIYEYGQRKDKDGKPHQEDWLYPMSGAADDDKDRLFILCDGMGGHAAGEVASAAVCEAMSSTVNGALERGEKFSEQLLYDAIAAAYDLLDERDTGIDGQKKMGTTMTFLMLHEGGATIAHIGDSRVYHIRPKTGTKDDIVFRTIDHSLVNDLVKMGEITEEEALHHPMRNVITRAMQPHLERRHKASVFTSKDIRPGDYFYMCSDGMLEQTSDDNLCYMLAKDVTDEAKRDMLVRVSMDNHDNHSAHLIHVLDVQTAPDTTDDTLTVVSDSPQKADNDGDVVTPEFKGADTNGETASVGADHGTARSVKGSSSAKRPLMSTPKRPWLRVAAVVSIALIALVVWSPWKKADVKPVDKSKADRITVTANGVSFKMIRVQGGTFTMGATAEQGDDAFDSDAYDNEKPAHKVTLSSYYIGQTEVTQELWTAVMGSNPSWFRGRGSNLPVEWVSWDDCQEFITKLNAATGRHFRLPTEAEWEYAARGGSKSRGYKYSGSNNVDDVAWYWKNSGDSYLSGGDGDWSEEKVEENNCRTHSVATKSPNELGIYDMSGNVNEWCQDWYGDYNSASALQVNPKGATSGSCRVYRGGDWNYYAWGCRSSYRGYSCLSYGYGDLGLRLVLSE